MECVCKYACGKAEISARNIIEAARNGGAASRALISGPSADGRLIAAAGVEIAATDGGSGAGACVEMSAGHGGLITAGVAESSADRSKIANHLISLRTAEIIGGSASGYGGSVDTV